MLTWWDLCNTVMVLIIFSLILITHPNGWKQFPCLKHPWRHVKALTFSWISCFGVPETMTSDRGPQFTSSLWFQICELLNISHHQTTAYDPESN
jgi:transposase InsO family protein